MGDPDSGAADADSQRVAIACQRLHAEGSYPGVRSVQRYLKEHLGGGIKTERIAALIRRWELDARPGEKSDKAQTPAPSPSLEEILEAHPDLRPAIDALAGALAGVLEARVRREAEERVHAVQSAAELAREQAAQHMREVEAVHVAALAERETIISGLRAQEAAQVEEIERLDTALAEQAAAADALRGDLARAWDELRQAADRAETLTAKLAQTEERAAAMPKLEAERATAHQSLAVAEETRRQMAALIDGLRADLHAERAKNDGLHERIERLVADLAVAVTRGAGASQIPGIPEMAVPERPPESRPHGNGSGVS